jgi:uncharacterized protein YggE
MIQRASILQLGERQKMNSNPWSTRAKSAAAFAILLAGSLSPWARGDDPSSKPPTISVTGTGKLSARPDIAEIGVGVTSEAPKAQDALTKNNQAMAGLFQTLKERGVAEKDIQTSHVQVSPVYSQPRQQNAAAYANGAEFVPRLIAYRVDNSVTVTSRKIESLGPLLDALVQSGANQIHGISFRMNDPSKLIDEASKRAVQDARHKAELLAGEAGVVLGAPLEIHDQGGSVHSPPGGPAFRMNTMMAAAPMPISPGEQDITASVMIVYKLEQPK